MAGPKAKSASSNSGAIKKSKSTASSTNGTSSPVPPAATPDASEPIHNYGPGRPDKAIFDAEQEKIKAEIDAIQVKLSAVKEKIGMSGRGGAGNDRRTELRAQLDSIRGQQSVGKLARGKVFEQLKAIQDGIQKRVKELNAARAKVPYKTVEAVDERIKQLDKQVESGNMKLVDEKRALQEISQCRRSRRIVEGFQIEQDAIEAERAKADTLRKELDDPDAKAVSDQYEAINAELAQLKKEGDEAYANRSKLMDERTALQNQIDVLYNQKRESSQGFREANDRYWAKVNEDRARRAERARAQRAAEEAEKKKDIIERLREEASVPVYQVQIEDCQTLIDHFLGKASAPTLSRGTSSEKSELVGVPKLEIRQVAPPAEGLVARKKKGEDDPAYFVATGGKKRGKKGNNKPHPLAEPITPDSPGSPGTQLHVPFPILSALLSLSIPPPTSSSEIPRVVEDLKTKKAWFVANQDRATAEQKEKSEAEIRRLTGKIEQLQLSSSSGAVGSSNGGESPVAIDTPVEEAAEQVEEVKEVQQS